ncbi:hypothetical protein SYNPS1DRAFT_31486 [Syncephalis pseudoplumigaleata]|uniref:Uncharacterized protein n=1 Tax=Syncephalis pseudoplumigaleata TaxID=1712513 RepID=A0A4P9YSK6_9FUNG|nr:hypothetical protein SYNPS1DRAFT_31486 [Syncephalis pseudoplumigaleata]|eukprot:RKP22847.1 hypothetical protein SYNPS1DRAFT_31486 [Syncephalis pseudoplumigaleata]
MFNFPYGAAPLDIALLPKKYYTEVVEQNTAHVPLIATIKEVFLAELPQPIITPAYVWLEVALEILTNIAFHLLLLLWHTIVRGVQRVRYLKLVQYMIILSFVVMVMRFFLQILFVFAGYHFGGVDFYELSAIMMITVLCFLLILFSYYGVIFWYKQRNTIASQATKDALSKVTKICLACFFGYLLVFTATILDLCRIDNFSVAGEILRLVFIRISYSIRIVVILFVVELGPSGSNGDRSGSSKAMSSANKKPAALSPMSSNSRFSDSGAAMLSPGPIQLTSPSRTRLDRPPYSANLNRSAISMQ